MTVIPAIVDLQEPRTRSSLDHFSRWVLTAALLVVAAVALVYMLLALPANDDVVRATFPKIYGWWNYVYYHMYLGWQGRWTACWLESAVLPRGDVTKTYTALIAGVTLVDLAGIYVVCRFFTRLGSRGFSLACALGLAGLLWTQMPSVAEAVYWFTGAVENAMVLAIIGMLLVGILRIKPGVPWLVLACIAAIITCGLHESYGTMFCIALATGTLAAYSTGSPNRKVWLAVTIAATVGIAIVILAPGNGHRMKTDGGPHARQLVYDLKLAGRQFGSAARDWLLNPKLLAASLWVAFSPRLEGARPLWPGAERLRLRYLLPIAWLGMLAVGFFAPSWGFGNAMPARTLSGNFIVFATGWLILVFVWTRRLDARDPVGSDLSLRSSQASAVARLLLAIGLLINGNAIGGLRDLANRHAINWRSAAERRFALLRQSHDQEIVVPRLTPTTWMLVSGEIDSKGDWRNEAIELFFHKKKVTVPPPIPAQAASPATTEPDTID